MVNETIFCVSDGLLLPEERLEDVLSLCWYISCWCLWPNQTECHQGKNSFLWQVSF